MKTDCVVSIYHDTRRQLQDGTFPVKLRVFSSSLGVAKLFPTKYNLAEKDFKSSYGVTRPRSEYKDLKIALQTIESHGYEVAKMIKPFSFEKLKKKLYGSTGEKDNIFTHYQEIISVNTKNGQIGNAAIYDLSLKSLKNFIEAETGKQPTKISFLEISPDWLNRYEKYMTKTQGRSRTTVGMYLRALRAVFNFVIREGDLDREIYPFGRGKYKIPSGRNLKKALSKEDISKLFHAEPGTDEQRRARAFWFFSYSCNGMNIKDIALLRFEDIKGSKFTFHRAKTLNTSKEDLKPILVHLTEYAKEVIKDYGNKKRDGYVFPILTERMTEEKKHRAVKNFTKFVNQNLKKLAAKKGITSDISTYWARHSFSTNVIRQGGAMEFVTEALGHADTKTTMNYFAGFEDESKKEIMERLMQF